MLDNSLIWEYNISKIPEYGNQRMQNKKDKTKTPPLGKERDAMKILDIIQKVAYALMCVGVIGNTIVLILHAFGKI